MSSVERRALQLFRQAVADLLESDQSAFRVQTPAGMPVNISDTGKFNLLHALQMVADQAATQPPLVPDCPNYLGIISVPPSPGIPLTSYDVWRSNGAENSFTLFKIMEAPVLDHAQRSLFRRLPTFAAQLPENINRWFENFGRWIHCEVDGPEGCSTDVEHTSDEEDPDTSNEAKIYIPKHKIVKAEDVKVEADPWIPMHEGDDLGDGKEAIKTEDPLELNEYVEEDFSLPLKTEFKSEQGEN